MLQHKNPSLMEQLAIRLSEQTALAKSLVIPRRRESSGFKSKAFLNSWIPAFVGMTHWNRYAFSVNQLFAFLLPILPSFPSSKFRILLLCRQISSNDIITEANIYSCGIPSNMA